jgi:hypothetical protein
MSGNQKITGLAIKEIILFKGIETHLNPFDRF